MKKTKIMSLALCFALILSGCASMNNTTKGGLLGGGGGKADMAQAGAKDVTKINDAFEVAKNLLS